MAKKKKGFLVTKGEELRTVKDAIHSLEKMGSDIFKKYILSVFKRIKKLAKRKK